MSVRKRLEVDFVANLGNRKYSYGKEDEAGTGLAPFH